MAKTCCQVEGGEVTYVHLLFDRHQILWSEGPETESFLPGPQIVHALEQDVMTEICTLFPELDPETGTGYGPAHVRPCANLRPACSAHLYIRPQR